MVFETERFFFDLFGEEEINFNCIGKYPYKVNGQFNNNTIKTLQQFNEQNCEIYFVVNSGGYKGGEITQINAVFIDLDCGRDENNNYYPLDIVEKYKDKKLKEIHNFKLKPTYIVNTRNGLHVYWLVNRSATIEQFKECEKRLIDYFKADLQVKSLSNPMRVPSFMWRKDPKNPYLCEIIEHNEVRYDIIEAIGSVPEYIPNTNKQNCEDSGYLRRNDKKECNTILFYYSDKETPTSNIKYIKDRNIEALQERVNTNTIILNEHDEVYNHLKTQDLKKLLGLYDNNFNCIFHNEQKASAGIIVNETNGHYVYNCLSSNCGFKGSVIEVVQKLTFMKIYDVLRFLRKIYKIEFVETDWQKEKKSILEKNQQFIYSEEFEQSFPEAYKRVKNYLLQLEVIIEFAKNNIYTENFTDKNDNPVFYISMEYLKKLCNLTSSDSMTKRIALLAYLGLINKLKEDEIPEFLYREAKHQAAIKKQSKLISFYSIPLYNNQTLSFAEKKANEYKEKGFTMRGWSRRVIQSTLGDEETYRVFPQYKGEPLSKLGEDVAFQMEKTALQLIEEKGWTTEKEIIYNVKLFFKGQKKYKETQIKRVIPDFLGKYNLIRRKLNKKLKELYQINIEGYPYIIHRDNN